MSSTTTLGTPPIMSKASWSPWQTQTSFSSPNTSHLASLEYGNDMDRKCILTRSPSAEPPKA